MALKLELQHMAAQARRASRTLVSLTSAEKNACLLAMANALDEYRETIKQANNKDIEAGKKAQLSAALLDRLLLNDERIDAIIAGFKKIVKLPDPIGDVLSQYKKDNGLVIEKVRVPIGVIAIIYESRPNVTADVAALCLKTSNAIILRGGADAYHSNTAISQALLSVGKSTPLPEHAIQLIASTDRDAVKQLVQLEGQIDLVIPRGGEGLIKTVIDHARVPIIKHYKGLCHTYVDATADIDMALAICENAKCQRPGVCNAMETLLVHQAIAPDFLPKLCQLVGDKVELRGDQASCKLIPAIKSATTEDWDTEYLDIILSIKVVDDIDSAIEFINNHGSHHSDAIISNSMQAGQQFCREVDSAAVYVNASTRFTDGAEFGMGAEIGISTDKLHARGPMGLEELTTYKYRILGTGQVR